MSAAEKFNGIWEKAPAGAVPIKDLLLLNKTIESELEQQSAAGMRLHQLFSYNGGGTYYASTYYGAYLQAGPPAERR